MSETEEESYTSTKHWGEIADDLTENGHVLPDVSEDIKKSMQRDCLDKYPDDESMMQIKDIK